MFFSRKSRLFAFMHLLLNLTLATFCTSMALVMLGCVAICYQGHSSSLMEQDPGQKFYFPSNAVVTESDSPFPIWSLHIFMVSGRTMHKVSDYAEFHCLLLWLLFVYLCHVSSMRKKSAGNSSLNSSKVIALGHNCKESRKDYLGLESNTWLRCFQIIVASIMEPNQLDSIFSPNLGKSLYGQVYHW